MNALASISNPLPAGVYEIDLYSPTDRAGQVTDGVPLFGRWRRANAHAVRVVQATAFDTHPRRSRVRFEVTAPPGAFPFGALGPPAFASEVVGLDLPSFADIAHFLISPISKLQLEAVKAAAHFLADATKPELQQIRAAVITAKANIAIVRGTIEAVRNGSAPNNAQALAGAAALIKESIAGLLSASASLPVNAPRRVIQELVSELQAMLKAIEEAPAKAIRGAAAAAKGFVTEVVVPFEVGGLGLAAALITGWYLLDGGKRSKNTDTLILVGLGVAAFGYGSGVNNLLSPNPKG